MQIKQIKISQIDVDDQFYNITTSKETEDLINSIKTIGIINYPIVVNNSSDFTIISGFRRISACSALGFNKINVRIMPNITDKSEIIKTAITDNSLQRELNPLETSKAFNLLSLIWDDNQIADNAESLGLHGNASYVQKIKKLTLLSREIKKGISADSIAIPIALELGKFDKKIQKAFGIFFNQIKQGLNKQREILTYATEIAQKEDIYLPDLIEKGETAVILKDNQIDHKQKAEKIRYCLKKRRFPHLSAAEKKFNNLVRKLKLPENIKLLPPAYFEGMNYTLKLTFKNQQELKSLKQNIDFLTISSVTKEILKK